MQSARNHSYHFRCQMIRPREQARANDIDKRLLQFSSNATSLPGVAVKNVRTTLIAQILESIRRVRFIAEIANRPIDPKRTDPADDMFDPLRAALIHLANGNHNEAFWLVFLATHFSKHDQDEWKLMRAVYGRLGSLPIWSWTEITKNPTAFRLWLRSNQSGLDGLRFGNHRKYESKRENSNRGLANVVESYIDWVGPPFDHDQKIAQITQQANNPHTTFDRLYRSLDEVFRWGRLARFDHVTMLGKIGLVNVEPEIAYLKDATGPLRGVALLLKGNASAKINIESSEAVLIKLGRELGVGQQILEDSLCNWQKSPTTFVAFR